MKKAVIALRFIVVIAISNFLFYACGITNKASAQKTKQKPLKAQAIQDSLTNSTAKAAVFSTSKTYILKVTEDIDPAFKTMLDGKILKEGDNKFVVTSTKMLLNFIIDKTGFNKVLLIRPNGQGTISTNITAAKRKQSGPVIDKCTTAYILCQSGCAINGGHRDPTNPNANCEKKCEVDRLLCGRGQGGSPSGVILQ